MRQIWELSDTQKQHYLGKKEFQIAMRLVALAQNGYLPSPTVLNETKDVKIPKEPQFDGVTLPSNVIKAPGTSNSDVANRCTARCEHEKHNQDNQGATIDETSGLNIEIEDHTPKTPSSTRVPSEDS